MINNWGARQQNSSSYIKHFNETCVSGDYWVSSGSADNITLKPYKPAGVHIQED